MKYVIQGILLTVSLMQFAHAEITRRYANTWLESAKIHTANLQNNLTLFYQRNTALNINIPESLGSLISTGVDMSQTNLPKHIQSLFDDRQDFFGCFIIDNDKPFIVIPISVLTHENNAYYKAYVEHEVVHYKQWLRGDLKFDGLYVDWNGHRKHVTEILNIHGLSRQEIIEQQKTLPWEQEAYSIGNPFEHL